MGTQQQNSASPIEKLFVKTKSLDSKDSRFLSLPLAGTAALMATILWASPSWGQTSSILPRFTNTLKPVPAESSPSVKMRFAQRGSTQSNALSIPQGRSNRFSAGRFLPARFRGQDGDAFGEDQARGGDPFGEPTVESPITESPFQQTLPQQTTPRRTPRSVDTQVRNPFGEPTTEPRDDSVRQPRQPIIEIPGVDPSPRVPPMDTTPSRPRLPQGSEFTPDPNNIPDLPMPNGQTRETDKAGTRSSGSTGRPTSSREDGENQLDTEGVELEDFDPRDFEANESNSDRSNGSSTKSKDDDRRRPFRSNIYRPAAEPSYRPKAIANDGSAPPPPYPYSAHAYPPNPYAANPYAANPYAANPYAANPYATSPYLLPAYGAVAGCQNSLACQSCGPQSCGQCQQLNCGGGCGYGCGCNNSCGPSYASDNRYAGCPTPTPATGEGDVYQNVTQDDSTLGIDGRSLNAPLVPSGIPLYYVSLFGGWSDLSDLAVSDSSGRIDLTSQNGLGLGFAFGQILGKNLRSELEFSYRSHDVGDLLLSDFGAGRQTIGGNGDVESYAGMLNLYWEFSGLCDGLLTPYIGGGVGAANVSADLRLDGGQTAFTDGEDSSFAYQYIVGMNFKVRSYSDLFVEYRHFAADGLRLDANLPPSSLIDGDGQLNYQSNNIFFGMRMKF